MNRLHCFKSFCRGISALALVSGLLFGMPGIIPVSTGLAGPEDARPEIISIQLEVSEVVVTVRVPRGVTKVTLEGRSRLGMGNWAPRAVERVDGSGGLLVIRIAYTKANEILRVRGDDKDELPAAFYKGTTDFNGQKDEGGDGLAPAPGRGNELDSVAEAGDANKDDGGEQRDVVESDIWSIHNNTLYFFNTLRGLQVIDLKDKGNPVVRGVLPMPAAGEQMYTLGDNHVILLVRDGCNWWGNDAESQAIIVNVAGNTPVIEASVPVKGYIRESRLVGTALYIASQTYITKKAVNPETGDTYTRWEHGTQVSAFDLKTPAKPVARETVFYSGYNNDIYATDKFLFVSTSIPNNYYKTDLRCIDISAPNGTMKEAATIRTAGRVADKFKMRLSGDTLTVISEELNRNSGDNRNRWLTTLETFSLANPHKPKTLGELSLAKGERLFATRFDADRVYIVTYERIDPLWIVDLSDPRKPEIKGELEVPGWSTYIQPLGDRLVSIGVDDTDNSRRVAVSLFDVSDITKPKLFDKVSMGDRWSWSEAQYDEKAFTVLPHAGLILVPYQGHEAGGYVKNVQIIDLNEKTLKKRGVIEHALQPRRATEYQDFILSISGKELLTVDATDRDNPVVKSEVELAWTVDQVIPTGDYLLQLAKGSNWYFGEQGGPSIRVASQDDPDTALGRVVLPETAYLSGASVNGDKLYLLQTQDFQSANPKPVPEKPEDGGEDGDGEKPEPEEPKPNVFLTVIDLANLPELTVLGELALVDEQMGWSNEFKANWLSDGKLLWSNAGGYRYWGWRGGPMVDDGMLMEGDVWWPGYGGTAGQLLCFDVGAAAKPSLASSVNLSVEQSEDGKNKYANRWNFSEAILNDNGLVYLSSQHTEYIELEPDEGSKEEDDKPKPDPGPDDPDGPIEKPEPAPIPQPRGYWVTNYELHVVDYTDMSHPVVRAATPIPGTLIGTSHGGALLYTQGAHWTEEHKWDGNWLDASSYDGLEAYLVDSVEQPQSWPQSHKVTGDGTLYMSFSETEKVEPDEDGGSRHVTTYYMQSLAIDETAKFALLEEIELETGIQQLADIGGRLVGQDNQRTLYLFDTTKPASLSVAGQGGLDGCLWFNLGGAAGDVDSGLWLPLGNYGAVKIDWEE
ncbi:beta-propeller domain-containing protein [Verrucomicrobia bacterium]|nr:beta-propeller domain-containing protein [Verrucomicrobiota bacterium]